MAQMDETDLIYNGPWEEPLNHYFRIEGKIEIDEDALVKSAEDSGGSFWRAMMSTWIRS